MSTVKRGAGARSSTHSDTDVRCANWQPVPRHVQGQLLGGLTIVRSTEIDSLEQLVQTNLSIHIGIEFITEARVLLPGKRTQRCPFRKIDTTSDEKPN